MDRAWGPQLDALIGWDFEPMSIILKAILSEYRQFQVKLTLIISFSLNLFLLVRFLNLVESIQILTVTQSSFDFFSC